MKRDHPRVCGEHSIAHVPWHVAQGSSPRMRGTRPFAFSRQSRVGIIPAYAGNTAICLFSPVSRWDHPRVCGEHHWRKYFYSPYTGSSPRMRGTRAVCCDGDDRIGIIPAYAGNTRKAHPKPQTGRDHPRVCGEHARQRHGRACKTGSSPRMRGTRMWKSARTVRAGIIPAYAGNTQICGSMTISDGDHPRVCGEHPPRPVSGCP